MEFEPVEQELGDIQEVVEEVSKEEGTNDIHLVDLKDSTTLPSGIWVNGDQVEVVVFCYKNRLTGVLHSVELESNNPNSLMETLIEKGVIPEGLLAPEDTLYSEHLIRSYWSIPSGRQLDRLREKSASYETVVGGFVVVPWRLKQNLFRYHLKRVDLLGVDESPIHLEYRQEENGRDRLTEESEAIIGRVHPSIFDSLYEKFRIVACLV